jgi:serine phosphatase RsbU (regulator of sigma subunit)
MLRFLRSSVAAAPAPSWKRYQTTTSHVAGADVAVAQRSNHGIGDFVDVLVTAHGRLMLLLLDISGRRGDASVIAEAVRQLFRTRGEELFSTVDLNESDAISQLALELNHGILTASGGVRCTAAFLGCYDPQLGTVWYINAGHTPALLHDSTVTKLAASGVPLGLFAHAVHDGQVCVIQPGGALVAVSKGIAETGAKSPELGLHGLWRTVQQRGTASAEELCARVLRHADDNTRFWRHAKNHEGTVLAIIRNGKLQI